MFDRQINCPPPGLSVKGAKQGCGGGCADDDGDDHEEDEMAWGCVLPPDRDRIVGILLTQRSKAYGGQLQL